MPTTVREMVRILQDDGWIEVAQKGSHKQFKHPTKPGKVTLPMHRMNDALRPGTLNSILKQAGLK